MAIPKSPEKNWVSVHKDPVCRAVVSWCFGKESKWLPSSFGHVGKLRGGEEEGGEKKGKSPDWGWGWGLCESLYITTKWLVIRIFCNFRSCHSFIQNPPTSYPLLKVVPNLSLHPIICMTPSYLIHATPTTLASPVPWTHPAHTHFRLFSLALPSRNRCGSFPPFFRYSQKM